ncbi:hypothetical protein K4L06_04445 [Lysobacter sp. BMK333-48F3]|uniref:hypothetical protein n=1 Tax=Lysobacter sp. BMK333-48F3 TaxID=2867962 RepID=UPI001C8BEC8F|nr:hypothetical protein [Lysobacter sp. BMK333-48F3]MBX9400551.1 hypothetical protein [Lysobacter sp. BMK333-48F3]
MNVWLLVSALLCGLAAGWLFYLATPQQQWRAAGAWPARRRALPGSACALLSLVLLWPAMGHAAAVALWLTVLMLVMTAAPFLGAWRARRRGARA